LLPAHAGLLLGFSFDPEDEGGMFLRNVGWILTDYALQFPVTLKRVFFRSVNENITLSNATTWL
jgi:hypothetical protein